MYENYDSKIIKIINNDTLSPLKEWDKYIGPQLKSGGQLKSTSVSPLLSTEWGQGCYYNNKCPEDVDGPCGHCYVGCVPTAMAQIMKYWEHPDNGFDEHWYIHNDYDTIYADFANANYQWQNMPNSLNSNNDAVANFMYHCAVSQNTDFGPNESGAYRVGWEMIKYFNYTPDIRRISFDKYYKFNKPLRNELDQGRPVYYADGGHAMVIDGYQDTSYFHINLGWDGSSNGYYYLDNLPLYHVPPPGYATINIKPCNNIYDSLEKSTNILPNVLMGSASIGDYDNDGDFDIFFSGVNLDESDELINKIFKNDGSSFTSFEINYEACYMGNSNLWYDYDGDGDLDLLQVGRFHNNGDWEDLTNCKILINNGESDPNNNFNESIDLNAKGGDACWADYNNDGSPDLALAKKDTIHIYLNINNSFIPSKKIITNCNYPSSIKSPDFNKNMNNDLLYGGSDKYKSHFGLLINNSFNFDRVNIVTPSQLNEHGYVNIGDYNMDGKMDFVISGDIESRSYPILYKNNDKKNFSINTIKISGKGKLGKSGDINNDGKNEITTNPIAGFISINNDSLNYKFERIRISDIISNSYLVDIDSDMDLDFIGVGDYNNSNVKNSKILINNIQKVNNRPSPPDTLNSYVYEDSVLFSWNLGNDDITPIQTLSYNIFIGTSPSKCDIMPAMSNLNTGVRLISEYGNVGLNTTWYIKNLQIGKYYWSVQSIDNSYIGSEYAPVDSFSIKPAISLNTNTYTTLVNSPIEITYESDDITDSTIFLWDFNNGNKIDSSKNSYDVSWSTIGTKDISLVIKENGVKSDTAQLNISVLEDTINPTITCIDNQIIYLEQNQVYYTVSDDEFDPINVNDNVGIETISNSFNNSSTLVGAQLPIGTTNLKWTITDYSGNQNECSFDVTVNKFQTIKTLKQKGIKIYPNPTNSIVHFEFDKNNIKRIIIFSAKGKVLIKKTNIKEKETFNLSNFINGIYIIQIHTYKQLYHTKIIKK